MTRYGQFLTPRYTTGDSDEIKDGKTDPIQAFRQKEPDDSPSSTKEKEVEDDPVAAFRKDGRLVPSEAPDLVSQSSSSNDMTADQERISSPAASQKEESNTDNEAQNEQFEVQLTASSADSVQRSVGSDIPKDGEKCVTNVVVKCWLAAFRLTLSLVASAHTRALSNGQRRWWRLCIGIL